MAHPPRLKTKLNEAGPGPTPAQVQARQRADTERKDVHHAAAAPGNITPGHPLPAVQPKAALPTTQDTRTPVQSYLDDIAPAAIVGRMLKFNGKESKYVTSDDDAEVDEETIFAALCDQTLVGWMRFNGEGQPPDRIMGSLYDGFQMPPRESLGDTDPAQWELGLSGTPNDPWQHHVYLVLQNPETDELFTFVTSSITGRRAIGTLLKHYDRVRKTDAGFYPLIKLKIGGFNHRDERIGWVPVPVLAIAGRVPRSDMAAPDPGGNGSLPFNDDIPY
jgi:hypothetical protein